MKGRVNRPRSAAQMGRLLLVPGLCLLALSAGAAYMRYAGPAPLRWQALPTPRPELLRTLPPLAKGDEAPPTEPAAVPDLPPEPAPMPSVTLTNPPYAASDAPLLGPMYPFQPEVLASLFYSPAGTNQANFSTFVPLQFIPPPAPIMRSSTATYTRQ